MANVISFRVMGAVSRTQANRGKQCARRGPLNSSTAAKDSASLRTNGEQDIFVHATALEVAGIRDLAKGQKVSFELEPDAKGKGPKAVKIGLA